MTQAERLIRNLCEERRLALLEGERAAIKGVPEKHTWMELSPRCRELVTEYRRIEKRQGVIRKLVKGYGYAPHSYSFAQSARPALDLINHGQRVAAAKESYARRQEAIRTLRTNATIASLGKSARDAQGILKRLQADLAKV
jgi:hypothetical protein